MKHRLPIFLLFLPPAAALVQASVRYLADAPPVRFGAKQPVRSLAATGQRVVVQEAAKAARAGRPNNHPPAAGEASQQQEGFQISGEGKYVVVVAFNRPELCTGCWKWPKGFGRKIASASAGLNV